MSGHPCILFIQFIYLFIQLKAILNSRIYCIPIRHSTSNLKHIQLPFSSSFLDQIIIGFPVVNNNSVDELDAS